VIAPSLALLGAAVIAAVPVMVIDEDTVNVDNVGVVIAGGGKGEIYAETPLPLLLKTVVPDPVHVIPSAEYAMVFVP